MDNRVCPIFYEKLQRGKMNNGLKLTVKLPCKHYLSREGAMRLVTFDIRKKPKCPLCRKSFHPFCAFR
jgi:hypothetical protein